MEGLTLRKKSSANEEQVTSQVVEPKLWLGEELLLLAIKENSGYCSFFNTSLSSALRGCILIELWLLGRIGLGGSPRLSSRHRPVIVKSAEPTGQSILDEALVNIRSSPRQLNVATWISFMNGESWNPLNMKYHLKYVRERMAKELVDKGVLRNDKQSYILFDMVTHPLADLETKRRVLGKVQHGLLGGWNSEVHRIEPRILSLIILAKAGDVIDPILDDLPDEDRDIASKRLQTLISSDFSSLAQNPHSYDVHWPVFFAFFGL